jgi:hypothetical protein
MTLPREGRIIAKLSAAEVHEGSYMSGRGVEATFTRPEPAVGAAGSPRQISLGADLKAIGRHPGLSIAQACRRWSRDTYAC